MLDRRLLGATLTLVLVAAACTGGDGTSTDDLLSYFEQVEQIGVDRDETTQGAPETTDIESARACIERGFDGICLGSGYDLPILPESLDLLTARARRQGEHVELDVEWNVSDYDRNLFSSLDDEDNVGDAGRAHFAVKDVPAGVVDLGLAATLSTLEDRFTSFDKSRPSYFYRDWNLPLNF